MSTTRDYDKNTINMYIHWLDIHMYSLSASGVHKQKFLR